MEYVYHLRLHWVHWKMLLHEACFMCHTQPRSPQRPTNNTTAVLRMCQDEVEERQLHMWDCLPSHQLG